MRGHRLGVIGATVRGLVVSLGIAGASAGQSIVQQAQLLPNGSAGDWTGFSLAMDGTTMIVGAPRRRAEDHPNQGSAYVYVLLDGVWVLQAQLSASDGAANDQFGQSVAVDGETAIVGAPGHDVSANVDQGAAYVFVRSGDTWVQQQKLTAAAGAARDQFGWSVAVSRNRALVGAPHDYAVLPAPGAAYSFVRSSGLWTPEKTFKGASDGDQAGNCVALAGTVAAVGAPAATAGGHAGQGLVRVYAFASSAWGPPVVLTPAAGSAGDSFGQSVAFGTKTLIVGATLRDVSGRADQGAAYVFVSGLGGWTEQAVLTASDGAAGDYFGDSVAIDGDTVLAGARLALSGRGSAYVFTRSGSTWTQRRRLNPVDGAAGDGFGQSVALGAGAAAVGAPLDNVGTAVDQGTVTVFSANWTPTAWLSGLSPGLAPPPHGIESTVAASGDTVAVGAPKDVESSPGQWQGAVYVYVRTGGVWLLQQRVTRARADGDSFGGAVALSGDTLVVGSPLDDHVASGDGSVSVFMRSGGVWTEASMLLASDAAYLDYFGSSVAIDGTTVVVGARGDDVGPNESQGSAYVFVGSGATWVQQAKLMASDGAAGDLFGGAVAVSSDSAAVGARRHAEAGRAEQGSVYVFVRTGTTWAQEAKAIASDGAAGDFFGQAVDIDSNTLLVGALGADHASVSNAGAAYVFTRSGGSWVQQAKLVSSDPHRVEQFGATVGLEADTAIVGTWAFGDPGFDLGFALAFLRQDSSWSEMRRLTAADARSRDGFGSAVALAGDTAVATLGLDDVAGLTDLGSAAVFSGLCLFGIDPAAASVPAGSSSRSVTVNAGQPSCSWFTTSNATWLTHDGAGTGSGDGSVTIRVAANTGPARTGTLTIAGLTFTVNQASGCTLTLVSASASAGAIGGTGTVGLTANNASCPWTAASGVPWMSVTSAASGTGATTVTYSVQANAGPARTGTLAIGGWTFTVTQAGGCTYGLTSSSASVAGAGGTRTVGVTASHAACPWTSTTGAAWLSFPSGHGGAGPGTLTYAVASNTGAARTGTLTIAGLTFTVHQDAGTTPAGPSTMYLAEGATSSFFDTQIALLNAGDTPADVTLRYLRAVGSPVSESVTVPARCRATVWPKSLLGTAEFSTVVESSAPIVVDRTMRWDEGGYGSHAETAVAGPALRWYLAEGATHSGFDLFYLVQNPNAAAAEIEVRYLRPEPLPVISKTYNVAPSSRFNIWVNIEGAELASTDVSAVIRVTNGQPVIVERAMYLNRPGQTFCAGHESAGITEPATTWFLAEGATGDYFDLFVLLANPDTRPADVRVSYLLPDGTTFTRTMSVAPNSRANIWVDYDTPDGSTGFPLADTAVSTTVEVTNGVPIIVERAMWWPGPATAWHEAHNSAGARVTGTRWALAEGEVGGVPGHETYILIANTSAFAGTATITLLFEDGTSTTGSYALPARSRTNIAVGPDFGAVVDGRRFGAIVESTGATPAQIVVERAMYSSVGATSWAAGTNALGTRVP